MHIGNDNYDSENGLLLSKAKEMLGKCSPETHDTCNMLAGGKCPLLSSAMLSFKAMLTPAR